MDKHREFWLALDNDGRHQLMYEAPETDKKYYSDYDADWFCPDEIVHVVEFKALKELLNINEGLAEKMAIREYHNNQLRKDLNIAIEAIQGAKANLRININQYGDKLTPHTHSAFRMLDEAMNKLKDYEKE